MSIESRMDEFEKVSHKEKVEDVKERMAEFELVDKAGAVHSKGKSSTLPYGVKRYKTCSACGEIMEIHELKEREVVYICKSCGQKINLAIS